MDATKIMLHENLARTMEWGKVAQVAQCVKAVSECTNGLGSNPAEYVRLSGCLFAARQINVS